MHTNNKKWLDDLKKTYPANFIKAKVLELGSGNIPLAGTIRPWFDDCDYIGVDIESGEGVDIIMKAKDTRFQSECFDTIISFSMLEHDLEWRESLANNLPFLKHNGMLFMCWGAEGNGRHMDVWALVPHQEVIDFLKVNGMNILDSFFEEDIYGPDCPGAYDLIAKKL